MTNRKFIKLLFSRLFSILLLSSILTGALPTDAQTRRGAAAKKSKLPAPAAAKPAASSPAEEEMTDLTGLIPPDKSRAMSAAFQNGSLPAQSTVPVPVAGGPEEQAAALAGMVAARDENSTAALMTALRMSGYGVRDEKGEVTYDQSGGWQGIALDQWQVAAMAKLYGEGWGVGLGRFGESLAFVAPEWRREANAADLVESVRAASASENPSLRFWANFIIELGRRGDAAFDLRNAEDAKRARLDAIQVALILSRLGADVNALARKAQVQRSAAVEEGETNPTGAGGVRFINASYGRGSSDRQKSPVFKPAKYAAAAADSNSREDAPLPCSLSETESVILDYNATATTTGFGQFLGYFENKGTVTKTPGQLLGGANALLIMMKLLATYAALESEIALEGGTLTRTKTTAPGERKALTAKVKIDAGKWQMMNCLRPALNLGGLDFSLPVSGALAGSRVDWRLVEGGSADTQIGRVLHTVQNIPRIVKGEAVESGAIVFLDTQSDAKPGERTDSNETDEKGESRIYVVGMGQKGDLSRESVRAVMKRMAVKLDIQVKSMRLKTGVAAAGTGGDLAGNAITFLTGDIPGGVVGTGAETIYRAPAGSSKVYVFPVKDWIPCDGRWRGTVTFSRVLFDNSKTERRTDGKATRLWLTTDRDLYAVKVNLEPGTEPNRFRATAHIAYGRRTYDFYRLDSVADCKGKPRYSNTSIRDQVQFAEAAITLPEDDTSFSIEGDRANLSLWIPAVKGTYENFTSFTHAGGCTPKPPQTSNEKKEDRIDGWNIGQHDMPYDAKNPNVIRGSRIIPGQPGQKMVVTWDLSRCQK